MHGLVHLNHGLRAWESNCLILAHPSKHFSDRKSPRIVRWPVPLTGYIESITCIVMSCMKSSNCLVTVNLCVNDCLFVSEKYSSLLVSPFVWQSTHQKLKLKSPEELQGLHKTPFCGPGRTAPNHPHQQAEEARGGSTGSTAQRKRRVQLFAG